MAPIEPALATASPGLPGSPTGLDADRTVVWLRGEHDASTVAALSETMARAMALDDSDLAVDLSEVQFMSAATVGVIIRAREFLLPRSRSLTLRSPSTSAQRVLDGCGLAHLLDPGSGDPTPTTGTDALGTWVTVPASDRVDPIADAATPTPSTLAQPIRVGGVAAAGSVATVDDHQLADESITTVAGRGSA